MTKPDVELKILNSEKEHIFSYMQETFDLTKKTIGQKLSVIIQEKSLYS